MDSMPTNPILSALGLLAAFAMLVGIAVFLALGRRGFTRGFWRPSPGIVKGIASLTFLLIWIALVLGGLYAIVWVLHAMWRAT